MREEDSARRAARRVHLQRGGGPGEWRSTHEISTGSREYQIFAGPLFDSPRPEEKIFPINTARNGRMNAGKNHRMTNCGGSSSGAFAFSPRFQRIFETCRAISPLDSPLLQEFLSLHLFSATAVLVKHSKLHLPWCTERASSSHEILRDNYEKPEVN